VSETVDETQERIFTGIPVSHGACTGPLFVVPETAPTRPGDVPQYAISEADLTEQVRRLEEALIKTREQIYALQQKLGDQLGADEARIFDAQLLILDDPTLLEEVMRTMRTKKVNVEYAFAQAADKFAEAFASLSDQYLRERAADVRDATQRVLKNLLQEGEPVDFSRIKTPSILAAYDLTPTQTAQLDKNLILGIATDQGSQTSHSAILARSLGLPAVTGLKDVTRRVRAGQQALLDGYNGQLIVNPSPSTLFEYGQRIRKRRVLDVKLAELREAPAATLDGARVTLSANIESKDEVEEVIRNGAEGVGLFRTEYLFLGRRRLPAEEEQYEAYREVAERLRPHPVIIRTLDIGGDKMIAVHDAAPEHNPFLGWRAIRICLQERDMFRTQLRAILRAAAVGNVKMMYPMISGIDELNQANALLQECKEELRDEGVAFRPDIEVGIMIEVPSAAIQAPALAKRVSFFSIGTNDLVQYTLAVDRLNPRIAHLYEPHHPAVIQLIHRTIRAAHAHDIWTGVCGEMAGDPLMVPLLLGLGADELSAAPRRLPEVKYIIRRLRMEEARQLAHFALSSENSQEVLERAQLLLQRVAPELAEEE